MSAFETGNKLTHGPNGEAMNKTMLTTSSLKVLDLADPQPEAVSMEDIAQGLAQHVRWAGQGKVWLSVAQHSVMVMRCIEQWGYKHDYPTNKRMLRIALMHDAHEAYIGDLSGGLKYLLRDSVLQDLIFKLDWAIEAAIPNLDIDDLGQEQEAIGWAERVILMPEYNRLFKGFPIESGGLMEGPLCPRFARALFLQEAERLDMYAPGGPVDGAS